MPLPAHTFLVLAPALAADDSRKKMGSFLIQSQFQTGIHSTSFFLTASAQNLLCLKLAGELGAVVPNQFANWALGAFVPALVGG